MKTTFSEIDNPDLTLARWRHGLVMYNNKDLLGRFLDLYGEWAEPEIQLILQIVRSGDVVIDVGAHIGADTIPIAKAVGSNGLVLSFEPQRVLFHLLCANVAINNLGNARPLNLAVGENNCLLPLPALGYGRSGNLGAVSLANVEGRPSSSHHHQFVENMVTCILLDEYLEDLTHCRLLKIDVEGMEGPVLRGAQGLIRRLRPFIYCELNRQETGDQLLKTITDLGYAPYWHVFQGFNPDNYYRNPDNQFGTLGDANVLCVPEGSDFEPEGLRLAEKFADVYRLFPGILHERSEQRRRRWFWR